MALTNRGKALIMLTATCVCLVILHCSLPPVTRLRKGASVAPLTCMSLTTTAAALPSVLTAPQTTATKRYQNVITMSDLSLDFSDS